MSYNRYVRFHRCGLARSGFLTGIKFFVLTILFCGSIAVTGIAQEASTDTTETETEQAETTEETEEGQKSFLQKIFPFLGNGNNGGGPIEAEGNPYADYNLDELNEALLVQAKKQNIDELRKIVEEGARINTENDHGRNALIEAARLGHIEVVKLMIKYGATLNAKDDYDGTALDYAAKEGHVDIVHILQKNGARR